MALSSLRKAIGVIKDQTSISIAKVASNLDPELEILIVKATSHDDDIPNSNYLTEILRRTSTSGDLVKECVSLISRRIDRTHDWNVALKSLILVHRLMIDGSMIFMEEIAVANVSVNGKVGMLKNLSGFKDEAHSNSSEYSKFVRCYGRYLDKKVDSVLFDKRWLRRRVRVRIYGDNVSELEEEENMMEETNFSEMATERVLKKMEVLDRLLDRILGCCPRYMNKHPKIVLHALCLVVEESFRVYTDLCDGFAELLGRFWDMEYQDSANTVGTCTLVASLFDELVGFYAWCQGVGFARPLDYPQIERISNDLLKSLDDFANNKEKNSKSVEMNKFESSSSVGQVMENNVDGMRALSVIHEGYIEDPKQAISNHGSDAKPESFIGDLVNLEDHEASAEEIDKTFPLSLSENPPATASTSTMWEEFPDFYLTFAKGIPAADPSNADWEVALVESASMLAKERAEVGGRFDALILNDMYDQGAVNKYVSCTQLSTGSASSLALPLPEKSGNAGLPLPGLEPEGPVHMVNEDPFAASLAIPPPPYVQIAEIEQKRQLMVQEQQLWQQYGANGMQGQVCLMQNGSGHNAGVPQAIVPYVMPYNMAQP